MDFYNIEWGNVEPEITKSKNKEKKRESNENDADSRDEESNGTNYGDDAVDKTGRANSSTLFDDENSVTSWIICGDKLKQEAELESRIEGMNANSHYILKLALWLLKDIMWYYGPVFSGISMVIHVY